MSIQKTLACSFLIVLPIWLWFSWPLPKQVLSDIPAGFACAERQHSREMIPGDHLQLLYRLWLGRDMIEGHTPWFHDLYQFNTGRDEDRFEPDPNFFFFTVLFSLGSWAVNDAFGYNAAGFVSVWLSYFFVWLLVRRYVDNPWVAGLTALIGVVLPYRWIPFLGGSTTGPDMMFVPALCLGLDLAVRENRKGGAALAGAALLLSGWSDTHVFFFSMLLTPAWCLVAAFGRRPFPWAQPRDVWKTVRAFWPFAVFAVGVALTVYVTQHNLKGARMAGGRSMHEVMLNSPEWTSFFLWADDDRGAQIYVGIFLVALLGAGWLASVVRVWRDRREGWRPFVVLTCLGLGLGL
ncbi:MAG: hypothetical protein HY343_12515, partial [Lentisphaerae bacterium]|nr:hypothetical protein [Lentisphaerota bacterium]